MATPLPQVTKMTWSKRMSNAEGPNVPREPEPFCALFCFVLCACEHVLLGVVQGNVAAASASQCF